MKKQLLKGLAIGAVMAFIATKSAQADTIFVGSWLPDEGDVSVWGSSIPPLAYSGIGAAEFLFSPSFGPGIYQVSTIDDNPANIDHKAWYYVYADGPAIKDDNYFAGAEGSTHYTDIPFVTASAYVNDRFDSKAGRNYAFKVVPDGGNTALLLALAMPLLVAGSRRFAYARA